MADDLALKHGKGLVFKFLARSFHMIKSNI
jgi:hypothetical protein